MTAIDMTAAAVDPAGRRDFGRAVRRALVAIACLLSALHTLKASAAMNGIWTVTTTPPTGTVSVCPEFLPSGTRVKLQVEGPTRQALEEQRNDELGGSLTLLAPLSPTLCAAGVGATTGFGLNVCEGPRLREPKADALFDDASFTFSRWSDADAKDPAGEFFASRGARKNARFVQLVLKNKAVEWTLWLKSPREMVSECLAKFPGKNNVTSFPMIWRRE
jgi:hypothetical protein